MIATMSQEDEKKSYPPPEREGEHRSQYPPPPGEEERQLPPVTLPPIRHHPGYAADPRSSNGHQPPPVSPPPNGLAPPNGGTYLPPLHPPVDHRSASYAPERREDYYAANGQYDRDAYHANYRPYPPPAQGYGRDYGRPPPPYHDQPYHRSGPHPEQDPNYPRQPNGYDAEYGRGAPRVGYPHDYGRGAPVSQPIQQAAPRQRTSIACRYCRKRKIRCSGYQNSPGGRCVNCVRMNQECVFQPVSSSSSAAFVHVSAVRGGIPPGTQLYGAYGEPLPTQQPYSQQAAPPQSQHYQQPLHSPTEPYSPYSDDRSDARSANGRRRRRDSEEGHDRRLPPPHMGSDEERRRRSPMSNGSSPGSQYYSYPPQPEGRPAPASYSPKGQNGGPPLQPAHLSGGPTSAPPPPHTNGYGSSSAAGPGSSGASTPTHMTSSGQAGSGVSSVMSLNNLVDNPRAGESPSDIDRGMLGRLSRMK